MPLLTASCRNRRVSSSGRDRVPRVQLVEVDLLHAEPAQRVIQCPGQVPAGGADVVGGLAHREAALRGHDRPVPDLRPVRQPPADDLLRHPRAVDVGGVDEVAARREVVIQDGAGLLLGGLGAESHGAQRVVGDDGAAVAQGAVLHGTPQCWLVQSSVGVVRLRVVVPPAVLGRVAQEPLGLVDREHGLVLAQLLDHLDVGEHLGGQAGAGAAHHGVLVGDDERLEPGLAVLQGAGHGLGAVAAVDVAPEVPFAQRSRRASKEGNSS